MGSDMKILPSSSDLEILKINPILVEKEDELLNFATLGNMGVEQNGIMNLRMELQKNDKEHKYENEKILEKNEKILELLVAQNYEIQSLHIQLAVVMLAC